MLWLEYWSIAYLSSTTSFFQVTRMDPPNRGHVFTLERVTKKNSQNGSRPVLAPWHVRFKASYRQCMAIGTSQREGSKLPGVLEATAGDLWSWYNWATKMGTKSPLRHLREASHSKQPLLWFFILADTPWLSYGWLSAFVFPPTSKNHSANHQFSAWMGCWQVHHCLGCGNVVIRNTPIRGKLSPIQNKKAPHFQLQTLPGQKGIISSSDVLPAIVESLASRLQ